MGTSMSRRLSSAIQWNGPDNPCRRESLEWGKVPTGEGKDCLVKIFYLVIANSSGLGES